MLRPRIPVSGTAGDPHGAALPGPISDCGGDLLDLRMKPIGDSNEAEIWQVVTGFRKPIDTEILGYRIFVVCYGGG